MKTTLFCFVFLMFFGESSFSQLAGNYLGNYGFKPSSYGGFELYPWWSYRTHREDVKYNDLKKWWKKHEKTLIKADKKQFKKFTIVEQGSLVLREYTEADVAAFQRKPGTIGHYIIPYNSFTSGKVKPDSRIYMVLVATPEDIESVYYNMASKVPLSKDTSFDMLIEYCNNYLNKFPNGNLEHRREVKKRLEYINELPVEVRKAQEVQILAEYKAQKIKQREADEKNSEIFWNDVMRFLSSPAGKSSDRSSSGSCSACSGRGYVYSGDNRRESCYVCGGSGKN